LSALHPPYPNPFNPSTTIGYDLPLTADVRLNVYDALGRMVARLVSGHQSSGSYLVSWGADGLPSGLYIVRLEAGAYLETWQLMLLK